MRLPWWRAALTACGISFFLCARAAEPAGPALSLPDAIRHALANRPELNAFAFDLREREARADAAAQRPAPELEFMLEDALGTGAHSGLKSAQGTLLLSQVIELGDKRAGRMAVAEANTRALGSARAIGQLDVVAEVARRFIEVVRGQARHELALDAAKLAEQTRVNVQDRVAAARAPFAEGARANAARIDAEVTLGDTEHDLEIAKRYLAAAMGERTASFERVEGDLAMPVAVASLDELLAGLEQSPDLLQFADLARVQEAQLRLAQLQQRANLRATLGVRRLEQSDDMALVAGVSIPLFAGRRAQPEIDASRARLDRVQLDRESAYLRLQSQLYSLYLQMEHDRELGGTLQRDLIPQLQQALELTSQAYERGRYAYLELSAVQRDLLAARGRLLETLADFHLLRIEIERLTATSLDASGATP